VHIIASRESPGFRFFELSCRHEVDNQDVANIVRDKYIALADHNIGFNMMALAGEQKD
jgi:hypothetical protein